MEHIDGITGVIFDYGGTIDSRGEHWSEVIARAWADAGIAVGREDFRRAYVHGERTLARERHILPGDNFLDLMRKKMRIEMDLLVGEGILQASCIDALVERTASYCSRQARECVDEARPVLDALYGRVPMVLVSNFYGNIEAVLDDFGLRKYFPDIIESAVVGVRKPDPAIFALGIAALGMEAGHVLVVGDSLRKDILPARSLGCRTAWLKGKGWTEEEDRQTDPSQIKSLAEVTEAVF